MDDDGAPIFIEGILKRKAIGLEAGLASAVVVHQQHRHIPRVVWMKGILKVQVTARGGEGGLALAHLVHVKAVEAWRQVVHYRSNFNLVPLILAQPDCSYGIALDIVELSADVFITLGYQIA